MGRARRVLEAVTEWAATRRQFGQPVGRFQGVGFQLADCATQLEAAELLVLRAAAKCDQGTMSDADAAMAMLYASEMLGRLTDTAVQIFGGMGLMSAFPAERWWRDARVGWIWDGTSSPSAARPAGPAADRQARGHIHQSRGEARIGRTLAISPGSEYSPEEVLRGPSSPCPARRGCAAISSPPAGYTVAVIGSARLSPPDPRCLPAEQIGAAIAAQGWTVMTGGYGGLMEVTSRAAAQAGGRVIGLPMRGWSHLTPNRWNHELRWSDTYPERLGHLLSADAMVAVDGGIGTLSEAAIAWATLQTEPVAAELIFLGAGWPAVLRSLAAHLVIDDRDLAHVTVCADPKQAIAHIAGSQPRRPRVAGPRG